MDSPHAAPFALGHWSFLSEDQRRFADLTGDVNPMHMDAVAARRLITGRPVVHGIHTMLAALERLDPAVLRNVASVTCEFVNPVSVGDAIDLALHTDETALSELRVSVAELDCTRIRLRNVAAAALPRPAPGAVLSPEEDIGRLAAPLTRPAAEWTGTRQRLGLPAARFDQAFPALCAHWGERRVAAIGALSTYVGMVCPGLHSVFSAVDLEPSSQDSGSLVFEVLKYDARFRLFVVAFDGPVRGQLRAFVRPEAQPQPNMTHLATHVPADAFAARQAWVIGGSRGLGELSAKLAAAGGADVTLTYATGADDARRVVAEITSSGRGRAQARALDVMQDDWATWLADRPAPDALFYFASPRIFRKKAGVLDAAQLQEFIDCYVHRFAALCLALEQRATRPVKVFVPSTVFIDERPRGMTEYAMAKAAAEVLAADLGRTLRQVSFLVQRLPKLATDQTATVMGTRTASNVEVLLPIVRSMLNEVEAD